MESCRQQLQMAAEVSFLIGIVIGRYCFPWSWSVPSAPKILIRASLIGSDDPLEKDITLHYILVLALFWYNRLWSKVGRSEARTSRAGNESHPSPVSLCHRVWKMTKGPFWRCVVARCLQIVQIKVFTVAAFRFCCKTLAAVKKKMRLISGEVCILKKGNLGTKQGIDHFHFASISESHYGSICDYFGLEVS